MPPLRPRTLPTGFIQPCLPTKAPRAPPGAVWLHEIKHDGFRVIARKDGARVRARWHSGRSGREPMALTMRPTGLGSGAYKNPEVLNACGGTGRYTAFSASRSNCAPMGRRQRSRPRRPSLMASWKRWLEWAKLGEVQ